MNKMNFVQLAKLFALAITLHNLEEAWLLPEWSQSAGLFHPPVGTLEFYFTVAVLTVFAYAAVYLAIVNGKESVGAYLLEGYALAMLLNVFFPHILATVVSRRYAPGTITALFLNLPITILLLRQGLKEKYVHMNRLTKVGPLVVLGILVAIPVLFVFG